MRSDLVVSERRRTWRVFRLGDEIGNFVRRGNDFSLFENGCGDHRDGSMAEISTNGNEIRETFDSLQSMAQLARTLSRERSLLFLCDMQERFRPSIKYFAQIVETSNKLLQACQLLEIPFVVTEQYPKGDRRLT